MSIWRDVDPERWTVGINGWVRGRSFGGQIYTGRRLYRCRFTIPAKLRHTTRT